MPSVTQDPANLPAGCSAVTSENKLALELGTQAGADEVAENLSKNKEGNFKGLKPGSSTNEFVESNSFGAESGGMTVDDVIALTDFLKSGATAITPGNYTSDFGTPGNPEVFLVDGNMSLGGSGNGFGILPGSWMQVMR